MADVLGENFDLELQKLEDENYTEYVSAAGKTSGVANIYKTLKDIKHVMQQLDPKKTDGGETQDDVDRKDTYGDGRIYQHVLKCPVCGKEMKDTPTRTGVCSRACELAINAQDLSKTIGDLQEKVNDVNGNIQKALNLVNSLMSCIQQLPEILNQILSMGLDDTYLMYFKVYLKVVELWVQLQVNKILIWKNNLIIKMLEKKKHGIDEACSALDSLFSGVNAAVESVQKLAKAFSETHEQLLQTIINSLTMFILQPQGVHFFFTIRSMSKGYNATTMVRELKPTEFAPGLMNTKFVPIAEETVVNMVRNAFPPMTEDDYFLAPSAFQARKALSNYNVDAIKKMIKPLLSLLRTATESLPKYENLKVTNVWWLMFLLLTWGPEGQKHFGFPNPYF